MGSTLLAKYKASWLQGEQTQAKEIFDRARLCFRMKSHQECLFI
jgi:hypothetical protein